MRVTKRKCSICKEPIALETDDNYFIEYKNNNSLCTHTKCYIEYHTTKKRNKKTVEECNEFINSCWAQTTYQEEAKNKELRCQMGVIYSSLPVLSKVP